LVDKFEFDVSNEQKRKEQSELLFFALARQLFLRITVSRMLVDVNTFLYFEI
jgi:hypothetical protein